MVPSKDREGGEDEACLYGVEYYLLEDGVVGVLKGSEGHDDPARRRVREAATCIAGYPPERKPSDVSGRTDSVTGTCLAGV
jgi:hypothetical protein